MPTKKDDEKKSPKSKSTSKKSKKKKKPKPKSVKVTFIEELSDESDKEPVKKTKKKGSSSGSDESDKEPIKKPTKKKGSSGKKRKPTKKAKSERAGKAKTKVAKKKQASSVVENEEQEDKKKPKKKGSGSGRTPKQKTKKSIKEASESVALNDVIEITASADPLTLSFNQQDVTQFKKVNFSNNSQSHNIFWTSLSTTPNLKTIPETGFIQSGASISILVSHDSDSAYKKHNDHEEKIGQIVLFYTNAPADSIEFSKVEYNKASRIMNKNETIVVTVVRSLRDIEEATQQNEKAPTEQSKPHDEEEDAEMVKCDPTTVSFKPPFRFTKKSHIILQSRAKRPIMWHVKSTNNNLIKFEPFHGVLGADTNQTISIAVLPFYIAEDAEDRFEHITIEFVVIEKGPTEFQRTLLLDEKRKLFKRTIELILQGNQFLSAKEGD